MAKLTSAGSTCPTEYPGRPGRLAFIAHRTRSAFRKAPAYRAFQNPRDALALGSP
ncbi:MAG: hypothetical protein K0Q60_3100 [Microvirga sp.]|nr:hypothetical protein [Microvirga sp.]